MTKANPFRYFKTSPEVIRLAVMMYIRFPLSLRNVEDLLHERGIDICHETVRFWWNRFGPVLAREIRKKRSISGHHYSSWRWHVDEVFVKINGEIFYLWRAIDHEGEILESYVSKRRNRRAALAFLKNLIKRYGKPNMIVSDRLKSYRAALSQINMANKQVIGRYLNNRVENSHLPFRRRERGMNKFRLEESLQKFSSIAAAIYNHFNLERHITDRQTFKTNRNAALTEWQKLSAI